MSNHIKTVKYMIDENEEEIIEIKRGLSEEKIYFIKFMKKGNKKRLCLFLIIIWIIIIIIIINW